MTALQLVSNLVNYATKTLPLTLTTCSVGWCAKALSIAAKLSVSLSRSVIAVNERNNYKHLITIFKIYTQFF